MGTLSFRVNLFILAFVWSRFREVLYHIFRLDVFLVFAVVTRIILGTLSKDVFERRTSTESEAFSLFICPDANKFVLLSFFSLLKTIYPRVSTKPLPNDAKSPLPVDVRRSKTLLLKLPIVIIKVGNSSKAVEDLDLQMRGLRWGRGGGSGHPDPEIGGGSLPKNCFGPPDLSLV